MNKKAVEWLYRELPGLVDKGVIPAESAERLKQHYGPVDRPLGTRTFLLVFGVIGAILVGLGIILILAHNWEQLSKLNRLLIAVGLLVAAQSLAGCVLWFKQGSQVWREAAAALLVLMVGAAMAIVGQTYHLTDDAAAFLLTWMLLILPVVYLMNSVTAAVIYVVGVTFWTSGYPDISKQFIWLLLGLVMPYYLRLLRHRRYANATIILSWVITICFYFCFGEALANYLGRLYLLIYSGLFTVTYLIGILWFTPDGESRSMPFAAVGLTGSIGLTFTLTFNEIWGHLPLAWHSVSPAAYVIAVVLLAVVIGGASRLPRARRRDSRWFLLVPGAIGLAYAIQAYDSSGIGAAIIINAYLLWLSISIIASGVRQDRLGIVNLGMLLIAALVAARFFDMELSFVVRGIAFVLVGLGFLAANVVLLRRKAKVAE